MVILSEVSESSSSMTNNHHKLYDVFLSFRGADTRLNFTNHLHKALESANLKIFYDDKEIETGVYLKPELETAIKGSRASVIVLSESYASSSWCLDELVLILDQHMISNQIVIPIFYHVEPTDVRKQQKTFKVAMDEHEKKMEAEVDLEKKSMLDNKIKKWKEALKQVADLKGQDAKGRPETDFIKEIIDDIYRRLGGSITSSLPLLIGMENSINSINSWMKKVSSNTVDILTISGMSGIGKTSVASHVYELHRHRFDASSFIEDISICAHSNGMPCLQKQLLSHVLKTSPVEVHRVSEYTSIIENALFHKKVFLVLDDVDSVDHLNALLGYKGLHPGSKIIITTKDVSLTEKCALFNLQVPPKPETHSLEGLSYNASVRLLCFHAFKCEILEERYEEVSDEIVKYCGGHPLALRLMGSSLRKKDVAYWEEYINELKLGPEEPISEILKKSFDHLSENDKELLKHIACFFIGKKRYFTETVLKACDIKVTSGITHLIERFLLREDKYSNVLMMHSLIQEKGRNEVRRESPERPEERSRLWCHTESYKVLKKKMGTRNIKGLALDMNMIQKEKLRGSLFALETDALSEMDDLKLLQLNYVQLYGSYKKFPKKLRWLCMQWFPLECMPLDLPMKKLVALDMSYSSIKFFVISYSNIGNTQKLSGSSSKDTRLLGSLKILDVSFCEQLYSLGGFFELHKLERLTATNCIGLIDICESIGECSELVFVDLSYCNKLEKIPLGKLKKVKTLLLDGCNLGESQTEINSQTSSSSIVMTIPRNLKFLVVSLPSSLMRLSLQNNNLYSESFPTDLSCLSMLKELILDKNPIVLMPYCVRTLPMLETLSMNHCEQLTTIKHPPPTLTSLSTLFSSRVRKFVFDPDMSPMALRVHFYSLRSSTSVEIEGVVKIQPMADVEERLLRSLRWSTLDFTNIKCIVIFYGDNTKEEIEIQMYYEFGIFSTIYGGREMPNWISERKDGPSISFTIPSSAKTLTGLNLCYVLLNNIKGSQLPEIKMSNKSKNCTWIYIHYLHSYVLVNGEYLIYISHWMFTQNEMEPGDHVTISLLIKEDDEELTSECGVGFVYDDESTEERQDALIYYKSWNHIIGGDLSPFQTTTGKYFLNTRDFSRFSKRLPSYLGGKYIDILLKRSGITNLIDRCLRHTGMSGRCRRCLDRS
ncbi:disease resistance protein RUN1-like [Rutidosis leptorrhynchoides]|uniref:disease resistance protein RUN1-like n=1 Tax=Rutidosis leptorrhynchoides TaxID=125765 RepID=UPI003A99E5A0